jgi:actin-related protein
MMMPTPLLSIFSVGLTSGLVIESGDGLTWVVPVVNGQIVHQAVQQIKLAGVDVNQNLKNLLMREGISIASSAVDEIIREIKEKNCHFILDPQKSPVARDRLSYNMPDGSSIKIPSHILYEAPEVLFNPGMLGYGNVSSIQDSVISCLKIMDKQYWSELLSHIVFSGGNLSYSGFQERFESELDKLLPQLGRIPKPVTPMSAVKSELIKLQAMEIKKKREDTCPQCGAYVDLSTNEYCPSCNARMVVPEIKIGPEPDKDKKMEEGITVRCPKCKKEITDPSSVFCPYCGRAIEELEKVDIPEKVSKKTAAKEFSEFFESANKLLRFFVPDNLQYAIFNGAAILGSLPSFLQLFITHEQFESDRSLLYRDISEIL